MSANKYNKRMRWQKWLLPICLSLNPFALYPQVLNGSFEIDGQPSLDHWQIPCFNESYEDAPDNGGSWCLKLNAGNHQGCMIGTASQIIPDIRIGEIWRLSAWARQDYFPTYTSIYFQITHATGFPTILSKDTTSSNTWTELTTVDTFLLLPGDSVAITLDAGMTTGPMDSWSYFDLVTVEKIGVLDTYSDDNELTPATIKLLQNYPNPFNSVTKISYQLSESTFVKLAVYDVAGHLVEILVNEHNVSGFHNVEWRATNIGSGLFFYRLDTGYYTETKKCLILK